MESGCFKIKFARIALVLVSIFGREIVLAADCSALSDFASKTGVFVPSDDSGRVVTGMGRVQFYSAPDYSCRLKGVFIIDGQAVDAYTEYREFTSIVYLGNKLGGPVMGWVRSNRLKPNGRGISRAQE